MVSLAYGVFVAVCVQLDLFERFEGWVISLEAYQLDEVLLALAAIAPFLIWFAHRRAREAWREKQFTLNLYDQLKTSMEKDPARAFPLAGLNSPGIAVDKRGTVLKWNAAAADLFGYSPEEATGQNVAELIHTEESTKTVRSILNTLRKAPTIQSLRSKRRHKSGKLIDVDVTIFPTSNAEGEMSGAWTFYQDVTAQVEQERLLNLYRQVWQNADVAVTITDHQGVVVEASPAVEVIFGISQQQLVGRRADQIVNLMGGDDLTDETHSALARDGNLASDLRYRHPDGTERVADHRVFLLKDTEGKRIGGAAITMDITHRKLLQDSLAKSEETLRTILDSAEVGITFSDATGQFLQANPAYQRFLGYAEDEIVGRYYTDFATDDEVADMQERLGRSVKLGVQPGGVERRYRRKDGQIVWGALAPHPVRDKDGKVVSFVTVTQDITERRQAEMALIESRERLQKIIDATGAGLWDLNAELGTLTCNDKLKTLSGYGAAFPGLSDAWWHLVPSEDAQLVEFHAVQWEGVIGTFDTTYRVRPVTGGCIHVRSRGQLVRDQDGRVLRGLGLIWDVTKEIETAASEEELRERLVQARKLETVGKMSGGIAHDFNNLLTIITGSLQLLPVVHDDEAARADVLRRAVRACDRAAHLNKRLLAFSRKQTLIPQNHDVINIVEEAIRDLAAMLDDRVDMRVTLPDTPLTLRVDRERLLEALKSILDNAVDAIQEEGTIEVILDQVSVDTQSLSNPDALTPGQYARIRISDTGAGMSAEVLERAIEPFYTTKDVGEGSGLGLSMAFGFLKQSEGSLLLDSVLGKGTTVDLYLPIEPAPVVEDGKSTEGQIGDVASKKRILIVEDEVDVRETTSLILKARGFDVCEAVDGGAALNAFRTDGPFDLIFSDVVMPGGMTGVELARKIIDLSPSTPIILTSGYIDRGSFHGVEESEMVSLLPKPYDPNALVKLIHELIAAANSPHAS